MSIYRLEHFLSDSSCEIFRDKILNQKKTRSFTDSGNFTNHKYIDADLTEQMFTQLQTYNLPETFLRPNNLIMTGYYKPGDQFGLHTDTGLYYNEKAKEKSRWTLLIYLNTVEDEGATIFYDDQWQEIKRFYPVQGDAILFDIDLWHKGEELHTQSKFWIGCEIIGKF